jgi:hypothetical protein
VGTTSNLGANVALIMVACLRHVASEEVRIDIGCALTFRNGNTLFLVMPVALPGYPHPPHIR